MPVSACITTQLTASVQTRAARYLALALGTALVLAPAVAGTGEGGGTQGVAEREISRRNNLARQASEAIQRGNQARNSKDYAAAVGEYRTALSVLPKAPNFVVLRTEALQSFCEVSVLRAEELAVQAQYDQANALLDTVLSADFNPECARALKLKQQIQDPERYNPAATPQQIGNVQEVTKYLTLGDGAFDLGEFDKAKEAYNRALAIDRHNTAARRGIEKVERRISEHFTAARDQYRASAVRQVDENWETAVPNSATGILRGDPLSDRGGMSPVSATTMREKIRSIVFPQVQVVEASLEETVQFLSMQSRTYDVGEPDPAKRGVNIVLSNEQGLSGKRITLSLTDVPLAYVLDKVAQLAGTEVHTNDYTIVFGRGSSMQMVTRSFRVPPGFFSQSPLTGGGDSGTTTDPFGAGGDSKSESGLKFTTISPVEFLKQNGIAFPEGSSASYSRATGMLMLRNTEANQELAAALVERAMATTPKQYRLQATMLEVNQEDLDELGFDTLLGAFGVGGNKVFATGGTTGNTGQDSTSLASAYPLVPPGANALPVGQNPVTAGNRSGNSAIPPNSIDSLLATGNHNGDAVTRAPSIFGIAGVFTDPQIQMVLRGVNQKKGVDVSSSPIIVGKSGQRAKVEVIREFPYPTEFEPPEIPQNFGGGRNRNGQRQIAQQQSPYFPVTPTTPTTFEKRDLGHSVEVEVTVGPDNRTLDVDITPSYSEFEGFINYGTPITTYDNTTNERVVITENKIPQPVFRVNKASNLKVSVWSGSTLVLAGLAAEEHTKVEDKTPIFGDLPFLGRFFRSTVEKTRQKVVIFMVRAEVIDPAGETPHETAASQ